MSLLLFASLYCLPLYGPMLTNRSPRSFLAATSRRTAVFLTEDPLTHLRLPRVLSALPQAGRGSMRNRAACLMSPPSHLTPRPSATTAGSGMSPLRLVAPTAAATIRLPLPLLPPSPRVSLALLIITTSVSRSLAPLLFARPASKPALSLV